jgi:hypothetical protein
MATTDATTAAGIVFPAAPDGSRSTTQAGAAIIAAALEPLDPEAAQAAHAERHWRRRYPLHVRRLVEAALPSVEAAERSARAGLEAAWQTLRWATPDGECPLADAMAGMAEPFATLRHHGRGDTRPAPWVVPWRGETLSGDALRHRIDAWEHAGVMEPSAAEALRRCARHPEWFDLSDRTLALLGAGSEAGPLRWLARWRANLVAVDVPRADTWQRILATVDAGNATLVAPVRDAVAADPGADRVALAARLGADLLTETPRVAAWLRSLDRALDLASLAYLDGERHVRVSLAMDAIVASVGAARADATFAWMATPTDVFAVPEAAARAAIAAFDERPVASRVMQGGLRLAAGDRFFHPNVERLVDGPAGRRYGVVDSLVIEQGPNYALAKRLQQWRAIVERAAGRRVSLNVAPSTTTSSVVKNPALAAGFAGADTFGIEVFEPETTNAVMAAMWVHDLRCDDSAANPAVPLAHPFELFIDGAIHGGLWRGAYLPRSALPFAAALGWVRQRVG